MIGVLALSATFLVIILVAILILAFNVKKWAHDKEESNQKRFDELTKRIDDTQNLFKTEVAQILQTYKNILK